jgi:hypothetical protein
LDSIVRKIAIQTASAHLAVRQIEQASLTRRTESPDTPSPEKAAAYRRLSRIQLESCHLKYELDLLIAEELILDSR